MEPYVQACLDPYHAVELKKVYEEEFKVLAKVMCTECVERYSAKSSSAQPSTDSTLFPNLHMLLPSLRDPPPFKREISDAEFLEFIKNVPASESEITEPIIIDSKRGLFADEELIVEHLIVYGHADVPSQMTYPRIVPSVHSVCFSPDGKYLAVGIRYEILPRCLEFGKVVIYQMRTYEKYCELKEYPYSYSSTRSQDETRAHRLSFSPNGRYLVVEDGKSRLIVWDLTNKRIRSLYEKGGDFSFSPNGRLLAFASDSRLVITNMRDGTRRLLYGSAKCLRFSPDGNHIVTGARNGSLTLWDVRSGRQLKKWDAGHREPVSSLLFTPDGRELLSVGASGVVKHWDVNFLSKGIRFEEPGRVKLIKQFDHGLTTQESAWGVSSAFAAISPDGRLLGLTINAEFSILMDVDCGKRQFKLRDSITHASIDFSPTGKHLALGGDYCVSIWWYARASDYST